MDWTDPILITLAVILLGVILFFLGGVVLKYRANCIESNSQKMLCRVLLAGKDAPQAAAA